VVGLSAVYAGIVQAAVNRRTGARIRVLRQLGIAMKREMAAQTTRAAAPTTGG